ncbi:MAG: cyclodeaminase/cyclohydrolase family protein [Erysipelotrichaceae bacterium]|nr:cyclodeaminase/cyclohydrolase family protein [Erysipelotrichaceae bacterium]MBR3351463.1 cyclodeaminase/cyclohydrolase family protein [Erysipelotrichaceae bacterium]
MLDKSLKEFTQLASSKAPVPGGGGVSGLVGSLAASLAEMVTNLTAGKKKYQEYEAEIQDIMQETEQLRVLLLESINKDAEAFAPLAQAYGMNKEAEGYQERMENCLKEAARPPYMIMKYCCRIIELDERLADIGSKLAVSDAATSVMLAHGAMYGGAVNVFVNTRLMKDREYADKIDEEVNGLLSEYGPRALNCYQKVWERLKG